MGIGSAFGVVVIGILFKLFSWPGASLMLLFGIIGVSIVAVITLKGKSKNEEPSKVTMFRRIILFGGLCLFLFALPTKTWLNFKYPDNPEYVQAILDMQNDPTNMALRAKVDEERKKLR